MQPEIVLADRIGYVVDPVFEDASGYYEVQDWSALSWKNIRKYIIEAVDDETGNELKNGEAVITGLSLDRNMMCFWQKRCHRHTGFMVEYRLHGRGEFEMDAKKRSKSF